MIQGSREEVALAYLQSHHTLSLATAYEGIPHAATLFYVNRGFILYFLSSPTSRHSTNIRYNPEVSGTIADDYDDWRDIKGIQLEGEVRAIGSIGENLSLAQEYVKKFPSVADFFFSPIKLGLVVAKKVAEAQFYQLVPRRMYFTDNTVAFGHREELNINRLMHPCRGAAAVIDDFRQDRPEVDHRR